MTTALVDHWSGQPGDAAWTTALDQISAGLETLTGLNPGFLAAGEKEQVLTRLHQQAARLAGVELAVIAAADDIAAEAGDKDVSAWLTRRLRLDRRVARAQVRLAADLDHRWTQVATTLAAGEITAEQARVIVKRLDRLAADPVVTPEHQSKAEAMLLDEARSLPPAELNRAGKHILETIDPDLFEAAEARRLAAEEEAAQRRVALTHRNNGDGTMEYWLRVPTADGIRFQTYLESIAQPRKQRLADKGEKQPWERLLGQAFVQLLRLCDPAALPHHGGDATTVMVTMTLDQLGSELGTALIGFEGEKITAAEARKLACNAGIIPVVLGADRSRSMPDAPHASRCPSSASCCGCATRPAVPKAATSPPPGPTSTTSTPGPPAEGPTSATSSSSAPTTTAPPTTPPTSINASPTARSGSTDVRRASSSRDHSAVTSGQQRPALRRACVRSARRTSFAVSFCSHEFASPRGGCA